jgi:hypothetical protein
MWEMDPLPLAQVADELPDVLGAASGSSTVTFRSRTTVEVGVHPGPGAPPASADETRHQSSRLSNLD